MEISFETKPSSKALKKKFLRIVKRGTLDDIKYLKSVEERTFKKNWILKKVINKAVNNDRPDMLRWLLTEYDISIKQFVKHNIFLKICMCDDLDLLVWSTEEFGVPSALAKNNHLEAFKNLCVYSSPNSLEWFCESFSASKRDFKDCQFHSTFVEMCKKFKLENLKWINSNFVIFTRTVKKNNNEALFMAASSIVSIRDKKLQSETVEWLCETYNITRDDILFKDYMDGWDNGKTSVLIGAFIGENINVASYLLSRVSKRKNYIKQLLDSEDIINVNSFDSTDFNSHQYLALSL